MNGLHQKMINTHSLVWTFESRSFLYPTLALDKWGNVEMGNLRSVLERRVLVEFKADITQYQREKFFDGLRMLAARWQEQVSMRLFEHTEVVGEQSLNEIVTNVNRADVMSVWSFTSQETLSQFLEDPVHSQIAQEYFKPVVKHRTIINAWVD